MSQFKFDLRDLKFNLFELFKIQKRKDYGLGEQDYNDILIEFEKFVSNEIYPTRTQSDDVGVQLTDEGVIVPEVLRKPNDNYYQNGWFALGLPEKIGGSPMPESFTMACLSMATGANVSLAMYWILSRGALNVIRMKGSESQINTFIPPMIEGRWGGTMCLTEAGAGSDVGALRSTATPKEDGSYLIKGVKIFISSGDNNLFDNMIHLVLARTPNAPEGTKGISLFIVPKYRVNEDGTLGEFNNVVCTKIEEKMGIHGSATCELTFGEKSECQGFLIGEEFKGMAAMFIMMNEARLEVALQGEAQSNLAYEISKKYAKERVQFGKEIIEHPDIRRHLLRMRAMGRGLRSLCLHAADLIDDTHDKVDGSIGELGIFIPICKAYATDQAVFMASNAIQIHGGYGFCTEYGVEQFLRDSKIATLYEGTNGIQAIDLLMRKVLKDQGKALSSLIKRISSSIVENNKDMEKETVLLKEVLSDTQKIMVKFSECAQDKKMNYLLQHATDFLEYLARIVVSWKLYESAVIAQKQIENGAKEDELKFYQSKIVDFKIYAQYDLIHNKSLFQLIHDGVDISKFELE